MPIEILEDYTDIDPYEYPLRFLIHLLCTCRTCTTVHSDTFLSFPDNRPVQDIHDLVVLITQNAPIVITIAGCLTDTYGILPQCFLVIRYTCTRCNTTEDSLISFPTDQTVGEVATFPYYNQEIWPHPGCFDESTDPHLPALASPQK